MAGNLPVFEVQGREQERECYSIKTVFTHEVWSYSKNLSLFSPINDLAHR